ncbi:hypothetical protein GQX73_g2028 [Xylaria multiplex]|uniref:GH16 domain-containing protein n=1 Tax=Xylaria multiplex TaxID=323545 RepID=A0A7C8IZP7_9PEZI|nr:hypothetical protein GQX73_g2028 [Xylaria multiplex]
MIKGENIFHCLTAGLLAAPPNVLGIEPDHEGSWFKARYILERFISGRFTVRFSLTAWPTQKVWWGIALWDDGPAEDGSQFNAINFGYTVDGSSTSVNTSVNLYDGKYHNATLEYNFQHIAFYFDGKLLQEITDTASIPADPMDLILGPRLVTGGEPLIEFFLKSIDWVGIE